VDSLKKNLRKKFRISRSHHLPSRDWRLLIESPEFKEASVIASYASYDHEPDTTSLNATILQRGKTLLLPKLNDDRSLSWIKWDGRPELLSRHHKLFEPIGAPFDGEIDLVIIPALAVDLHGYRLGQGGGSYDRALINMKAWKVALINDEELSETPLPAEYFDQPVNAVVTPTRIVRF
jgi:5-formyltetrahydrofolate cyclo-ligase